MHEASAFFTPLVAASRVPNLTTREHLMRGVTAALGGYTTPPMPRPLPELPLLLAALPQRTRPARPVPLPEHPTLHAFFPAAGYSPVEGEELEFWTRRDGDWVFVTGRALIIRAQQRGSTPGWLVLMRVIIPQPDVD